MTKQQAFVILLADKTSTLYLEKLLSIILQAFVPIEPVAPKIDTFFKKKTPKTKKVYKNIE